MTVLKQLIPGSVLVLSLGLCLSLASAHRTSGSPIIVESSRRESYVVRMPEATGSHLRFVKLGVLRLRGYRPVWITGTSKAISVVSENEKGLSLLQVYPILHGRMHDPILELHSRYGFGSYWTSSKVLVVSNPEPAIDTITDGITVRAPNAREKLHPGVSPSDFEYVRRLSNFVNQLSIKVAAGSETTGFDSPQSFLPYNISPRGAIDVESGRIVVTEVVDGRIVPTLYDLRTKTRLRRLRDCLPDSISLTDNWIVIVRASNSKSHVCDFYRTSDGVQVNSRTVSCAGWLAKG